MDVKNLKIAIYGAGAMGTVLGALLTKGGLESVQLFTRNQAHVDGLNKKGAMIDCVADDMQMLIPVKAFTPEQMQGKYDVIFLMTKQRHNADILQFLLPHLAPDGVICTTQNGLPEERIGLIYIFAVIFKLETIWEFQIWVRWNKHAISWNAVMKPDRLHEEALFCRL